MLTVMNMFPDGLLFSVPHDPADILLQIFLGLVLALILGSFFEFYVHKYVMHKGLPFFGGNMLLPQQQRSHAILHHKTYYKQFDHEDDPLGKEESIVFTWEEMLLCQLALLPAYVAIAWIATPLVAACFPVVVFLHNNLWNIVHREMHQPKHPQWTKTGLYRFYARYHFLHHRHTGTNYNVVLPFADLVLGHLAIADDSDMNEIARLGYDA